MKEYLTNRQIAFIIFGVIVGYGIMPLTKNIVEKTGTGGWFALCIAITIAVFFTYIVTYLGYVHENKTIDEYSEILTGKYIGFIFVSIYIVYYFLAFTIVTRIVSEFVKLTVLLKTPVWALSLLILFVSYYAVIKGLGVIARICEIYGGIIIIGFLIIILSLFTEGKLINLKPLFVTEDIITYFKATSVTIGPLMGMELISIIPFDRNINNKKIFKYTIFMIIFIGILYILEVEACIAILGDSVIHYKGALLTAVRSTEISAFQFLRRLDGVVIGIWLMAIFCTVTIWAYGATFLMHKYCKKISFNLLSFILIILSFFVSRIPKTIGQVEEFYKYIGYMGFVAAGVIPTILFVMTKIKKYDKKI
ncbi:GerAB/ArcD/ProY family transporter [Crassaminicella profunda]|uniref:GerAB/ArcD/ProY family transporter n=1 Tax=Crassaminicella profunda TaxID=1286698 RepID=UPI001CA741A2|nr:endospore germination permease [Crassaminicella profunda]QZY56410.1 spore germination protein [Crassaminicella profunda]